MKKIPFETAQGEGAFYGPKLDIIFMDSLKRKWQLGTLQCDFNLPQTFHLTYTDKDNSFQQPVLLHRAILGSMERFIGIYIEHCAGWLPLWLSPIQAVVMNISKEHEDYAQKIYQKLQSIQNIRLKMDMSSESLGYKIRTARLLRIPYMIIVGQKEVTSHQISVRTQGGKTVLVDPNTFVSKIKFNIQSKEVGYPSF